MSTPKTHATFPFPSCILIVHHRKHHHFTDKILPYKQQGRSYLLYKKKRQVQENGTDEKAIIEKTSCRRQNEKIDKIKNRRQSKSHIFIVIIIKVKSSCGSLAENADFLKVCNKK